MGVKQNCVTMEPYSQYCGTIHRIVWSQLLWATYKVSNMKNLIFLFSLLITTYSFGQTSIYHPFPDSNSGWNYSYYQYMCMFGDAREEYSIIIAGDTTINSQTYHKLSIPYVSFYCPFLFLGQLRLDHLYYFAGAGVPVKERSLSA